MHFSSPISPGEKYEKNRMIWLPKWINRRNLPSRGQSVVVLLVCAIASLVLLASPFQKSDPSIQTRFLNRFRKGDKSLFWDSYYPVEAVDTVLDWEHVTRQGQDIRVKAAFVVVVQESDVYGLRATMRDIELRFNKAHGYPWVIMSERPFTPIFRKWIKASAQSPVYFGQALSDEWNEPIWINTKIAEKVAVKMANKKVAHGESMSWRKMTRYNAGFLAHHPLLKDTEFYWKVQPGARYQCNIDGDPFEMMKRDDKKLAFALTGYESESTMQNFWRVVRTYIEKNKESILPSNQTIYPWILDRNIPDETYAFALQGQMGEYWGEFNECVVWNNFMIVSLEFLRSKPYTMFFHHMDKTGGFFYERWGDAPFQTVAAALFLKRDQVHYMKDLGYGSSIGSNCPTKLDTHSRLQCTCNIHTSLAASSLSCTPAFIEMQAHLEG
ncbi:nucleotide-diphospho-sugar transferase [Phycomyces nitens]|nr:nucleotide-diphospho-sugar transferase [Phycomyces nitens]